MAFSFFLILSRHGVRLTGRNGAFTLVSETFAQHQIEFMVEHFVYCSVEPRKISRVNIADAPDNAIMRHGSAD